MTAPVVCNDAIAELTEEQHLAIPVVAAERPAVRENDRLTCSPIFVVNLRAVFRRDCRHLWISLYRISSNGPSNAATGLRGGIIPETRRFQSYAQVIPGIVYSAIAVRHRSEEEF